MPVEDQKNQQPPIQHAKQAKDVTNVKQGQAPVIQKLQNVVEVSWSKHSVKNEELTHAAPRHNHPHSAGYQRAQNTGVPYVGALSVTTEQRHGTKRQHDNPNDKILVGGVPGDGHAITGGLIGRFS